ncbi:hypothetical protein PGTUg99_002810 [Puccinia graminis f. sp. tritici]|uniref:Uncharacterized protein n=1 Tax=Puccinia graminis f. sp. tritici TaxID=56615 RepID=A0A5B0N8G9_PUCGR|nr:hypothetical protein PGTUg99_002810 [Puccinia graminis f. sp. tritici]
MVGMVPFKNYCGRQLTCRCGSPIGHKQCEELKEGTHQTCEAGCGWRDEEYVKLCTDQDHHQEPCKAFLTNPGSFESPSSSESLTASRSGSFSSETTSHDSAESAPSSVQSVSSPSWEVESDLTKTPLKE